MTELFLKLVNMSISAGWLVLAILIARLLLKKAPKWVNVLLWGIVAVRLVCPFTLESVLSLIPKAVASGELVSQWQKEYVGDITIIHDISSDYAAAVAAGREPIADGFGGYYVVTAHDSVSAPATVGNTFVPLLSVLWLLGIAAMAIYSAVSYLQLRRRVATAVRLKDNIFQSENVPSPFVLGILRPGIYLPFALQDSDLRHVIAHEKAHIRRRDHWWKPLGFALLTLHWFNPLLWLGYILLCRDIELACDEKVIKELGADQRADYSQALLSCGVSRRSIAACPLAFGEVGVKKRVTSVLHYKKPAFWIIVMAVVLCFIVAVCFLTDPMHDFAAELPQYVALEDLPKDYGLHQAKQDGCVVMEDGDVTSGEDIWQTFIAATKRGQKAQVRYVDYYTPNIPESYPDDLTVSPSMYVHDLTYDGRRYTARWYEGGKEISRSYKYLLHLTGNAESRYAAYQSYDRYVLTDRNDVTWEDIFAGLVSSSHWAHIDHLSVYVDLIYKYAPSDLELQVAADSLLAEKEEFGIGSVTVDTQRQCLHITVSSFSDPLYAFIAGHISLNHVHISLIGG